MVVMLTFSDKTPAFGDLSNKVWRKNMLLAEPLYQTMSDCYVPADR